MTKRESSRKRNDPQTVWGKKDKTLTATLSEEGWRLAKKRATKLGISVSEVIERWARNYDVNFGDAQPMPIPTAEELREKVIKSLEVPELHQVLGEKLEVQREQEQAKDEFLEKLAEGNLSELDVIIFAGFLDLEDAKADGLMEIAKLLKRRKKPNGV